MGHYMYFWITLAVFLGLGMSVGVAGLWLLHRRGMRRCLWNYITQMPRRRLPRAEEDVHILICFADHYEPKCDGADEARSWARLEKWRHDYPQQFGEFRDSDGKPPQWTFFYPYEEYEPEYMEVVNELCRAGYGEVEIHLHHDHDTAANLRQSLTEFRDILVQRHGLLSHDKETGAHHYAFIHGNWALCNWHGTGKFCGVNEELTILRETGCYVDMTMPSAPMNSQCPIINSIYYASDTPGQPRGHETGIHVGHGPIPDDSLLLIQGPLIFDWHNRKRGLIPSLENGCIQTTQPASIARLDAWLKARVQVPSRPDWFFVKLHMHGGEEIYFDVLLGEPMVQFHRDLAEYAKTHPHFHFHYVTAREMYNLVKAAEDGWTGSVNDARDYRLVWNGGQPLAPEPRDEAQIAAHG